MRRNVKLIEIISVVLVVALGIAVFWQPLRWMFGAWMTDSYYSHGFLVPLISAALVWRARPALRRLAPDSGREGVALLVVAVVLAVVGVWQQAYFVASLGLPVLVAGLALYLKGRASLRHVLFPAAYLVLMIPLPFVASSAWYLQVWTSGFATAFANLISVPALQDGAVVTLPNVAFVVGVACSGLSSIVALLALGTLVIYLSQGSTGARIALVICLVPIAVVSNGLRVGSLLWVAYRFGEQAGISYHDTFAGPFSWIVALALLACGLWVTRCRFNPVASS